MDLSAHDFLLCFPKSSLNHVRWPLWDTAIQPYMKGNVGSRCTINERKRVDHCLMSLRERRPKSGKGSALAEGQPQGMAMSPLSVFGISCGVSLAVAVLMIATSMCVSFAMTGSPLWSIQQHDLNKLPLGAYLFPLVWLASSRCWTLTTLVDALFRFRALPLRRVRSFPADLLGGQRA